MADASAHLQQKSMESASSTTDDTHNEIRLTVQPEVKCQTQSTTTTPVWIMLGLLSAGVLVALAVSVVAVVINQQKVSELKERIHSLQEMTHELQTMPAKLTKTELPKPLPATTAAATSATAITSSVQEMTNELPATATTTSATAITFSVTCKPSDFVGFENMPSCAAIHTHLPVCASGVYVIYPGGRAVWCDMVTDGGGWTRFQNRQDGSVAFNETWEVYQKGFGSAQDEFWLGNDDLHRLTTAQPSELRVDLSDADGVYGYAKYSTFSVGNSSTNYQLHVGGYSGNIGDCLTYHNSRPFTTKDRDNDEWSEENCANSQGGSGGWWYGNCRYCNLNGRYYTGNVSRREGVYWWLWRSNDYSYKMAAMLTRPRNY